jgi:subtilase family serine protease
MAARSARLTLGGCAAVLALAACSAGSSTAKHASPAANRSSPQASDPATPAERPVVPGEPGAPPRITGTLSPAQLVAAYDTGPLRARGITGKGQTIVIILPFGSPTIRHDLAVYDKAWHLPAPPSFHVIAPVGPVPPFRRTLQRTSFATEATLDVQAAHTMAPGAALVLAELPTNDAGTMFHAVVPAEVYVIRHHLGSVISMSMGNAEAGFPVREAHRAFVAAGLAHSMITTVAGSGDRGAAEAKANGMLDEHQRVSWPASDPLVVAVGGTQLELGEQATGAPTAPATSWPHSGGGLSSVFARPSYQSTVAGVAGPWRAVPDISLDASATSGLEVYATPRSTGLTREDRWFGASGTSLAAPLFAGVVALADQMAGRPLGVINPLLYRLAAQHDPGIIDVQGRGNTFRIGKFVVPGFPAGPGYDLVTGLGTIDAAKFVPDLVRLARLGTS